MIKDVESTDQDILYKKKIDKIIIFLQTEVTWRK